ncbi:MAG TPA: TadE/TadG family type IV pilus assembly protein [Bacillota bacterium]
MAWKPRRRRRNGAEAGQALVELSIALPVLLLLLLGVMEFGFMFSSYLGLLHGAREGVRAAALGADDQEVRQRIESAAIQLDPSRLTIQVQPAASQRKAGSTVTVLLTYRYEPLLPGIDGLLSGLTDLRASYQMRVE